MMVHQLAFCELQFPTPHVCILCFAEGVNVCEEMAMELLSIIEEDRRNPTHLIFNPTNHYSYQSGALNLLCNKKMFTSINIILPSSLASETAECETIVCDRKLNQFDSLEVALAHIQKLKEKQALAS